MPILRFQRLALLAILTSACGSGDGDGIEAGMGGLGGSAGMVGSAGGSGGGGRNGGAGQGSGGHGGSAGMAAGAAGGGSVPDGGGGGLAPPSGLEGDRRPEMASADGRAPIAPADGSVAQGPGADASANRDASARPDQKEETADVASTQPSGDPEGARLAGITRLHNVVRAAVGVPDLSWDPGLAAVAQAYASRCMYQHSMAAGLGENIAANYPVNRAVSAVVDSWAGEKKDYHYDTNSCSGAQCGHYTQIVWKTSTKLGCGVQICMGNSPFMNTTPWEMWVCNFTPPGNVNGARPY